MNNLEYNCEKLKEITNEFINNVLELDKILCDSKPVEETDMLQEARAI